MNSVDKAALERIAPSLVELAGRCAWRLQLHHLGRALRAWRNGRAAHDVLADYSDTAKGISEVRKFVESEIADGRMLSEYDIEETFEVKA